MFQVRVRRMKEKLNIALLLFCILSGGLGDSKATWQPQNTAQGKSSLKLTTSILEQSYCTNGAVRMLLRFRYSNTGSEAIVLPRSNFAFPRVTISRSQEAAAKRRYEVEVPRFYPTILNQPFPSGGPTPDPNGFVILQPGESYEEDAQPSYNDLFLESSSGGRLRKGDHVLQISVRTWNEMPGLAEELSIAWRKFGVLWWQGVTSEPMAFTVEKPASTIDCKTREARLRINTDQRNTALDSIHP